MVTKRQEKILKLIISLYAKDKVPVGSKLLINQVDASSATIRNDMKTLEDLGLLQKEHLSSGRIPSLAGYKYFIENLLELSILDKKLVFNVMKAFDKDFYSPEDIFKTAVKLLSDLTGYTSLILNVPMRDQYLVNFNTVVLDNHSVLAVMTLNTGVVKTTQFILPKSLTEQDLSSIEEIVHTRLVGKNLLDIHYALRTEIPQIVANYLKVVDSSSIDLFDSIFSDLYEDEVIISGKHNIFDYTDNNKDLYKLLSDDKTIIKEIRRLTKKYDGHVIDLDGKKPFNNLSVIVENFLIPYRGVGSLALVAPVDIDYKKVVSLVDLVSKILSMKLADYYRYLDGNHYEIK